MLQKKGPLNLPYEYCSSVISRPVLLGTSVGCCCVGGFVGPIMWKLKPEEGNKGFTLVLKDCCLERLAQSTCFMPVLRGSLGTTAHCESSACLTLIAETSPRDSLESSTLLYIFPVPIFALLCVTTGSVFLSASNFPASCPGTKQSYAAVEFDQLYNYTGNVISEIINVFFLLCLDGNVWVIAVN